MVKTITTFLNIKKGQKFKVVKNTSSHNYPLNVTLTFKQDMTNVGSATNIAEELIYGNTIRATEIELITSQTLQELKDEKKTLTKEYNKRVKEIDEKVKICEDNDLEELDEDILKVYKVLKVVEEAGTRMEKAKVIADLIK